jgi:energy-coupling factor transporter transmembrane protein EcfT
MGNKIPLFLLAGEPPGLFRAGSGKTSVPTLDKTIGNTAKSLKTLYLQADSAVGNSFICLLNPVVKVVSFIYLIVIISLAGSIPSQVLMGCFIFMLFLFARINVFRVYKKVMLLAVLFGFLASAPAALNVITPGDMLVRLFSLSKPVDFWIYHIPAEIGITVPGGKLVIRLFLRVFNSVSLSLLLVYSTPFPYILKAFRRVYVPDTLLMVVWLGYKFIFILCRTIEESFLALKSRFIRNVESEALRKIVSGRLFFIYKKAQITYEHTYSAMISRGYEGKIILVGEHTLSGKDFLILFCVAFAGAVFLFI